MPTYNFSCSKCEHIFELTLTFSEFDALGKKKQPACIKCKRKKCVSLTYETVPDFFVSNVNTIGQLADKNVKKVGKAKIEEIEAKKPTIMPKNDKTPWYGKLGTENAKKIFSGTKKEQKAKARKYIREGTL